MKTTTNILTRKKECKHSIVFEPAKAEENTIASSIYINKGVIPTGAQECKVTVSWPDSGQDEAYKTL